MIIWATINTEFGLRFVFCPLEKYVYQVLVCACVHKYKHTYMYVSFGLLDMLPNSFPPAQV